MADTLVLGTSVFDVQVQVLSPAPRRRGLCIVRDDFSFCRNLDTRVGNLSFRHLLTCRNKVCFASPFPVKNLCLNDRSEY